MFDIFDSAESPPRVHAQSQTESTLVNTAMLVDPTGVLQCVAQHLPPASVLQYAGGVASSFLDARAAIIECQLKRILFQMRSDGLNVLSVSPSCLAPALPSALELQAPSSTASSTTATTTVVDILPLRGVSHEMNHSELEQAVMLDDITKKLAMFRDAVAFACDFTRDFDAGSVEDFVTSFAFDPDEYDFIGEVIDELKLDTCLDGIALLLEARNCASEACADCTGKS